jgi:hypothetical protein
MIGAKYATVFPDPVCEPTRKCVSGLAITSDIQVCCTTDGVLNPSPVCIPSTSEGLSDIDSNVLKSEASLFSGFTNWNSLLWESLIACHVSETVLSVCLPDKVLTLGFDTLALTVVIFKGLKAGLTAASLCSAGTRVSNFEGRRLDEAAVFAGLYTFGYLVAKVKLEEVLAGFKE